MDRHHKVLYGFGTGVIIGAAAGLLLAPKTGQETRKIVADRAGSIRSRAAGSLRLAMRRRNSRREEASPGYDAEVSD